MKVYDLKPTYDNLMKTFVEDAIGRNTDVLRFVRILNGIEGSCAIALDGNWGSGKTFFVKQTKMVLDAYNENIKVVNQDDREKIKNICSDIFEDSLFELQPQVCVYYDAWENDNDDDPVLSLVYTILNDVDTDFSFEDVSCIKVAASIMEVFSGRNWTQLIENFKSASPLNALKESKNIEQLVQEFLKSLLPERGNRLIVFIDELDRCKPSYAVRLLERIKHYFTNDQITFVFSVNTNELQHTIQKYYGNEFDSSRYLDRFFDLRVTLPPANLQKFYQSLNFNDSHYTFDIVCGAFIKAYHLELREIARYIRFTKIAAYDPTHNDLYRFSFSEGRAELFCLLYVIPIMIGLKVSNTKKYADFIEGRDYTPLNKVSDIVQVEFFKDLLNRKETYDELDTTHTVVTVAEKLKEVYNALFATNYGIKNYYIDIGNMRFQEKTKELLLRTSGLLSQYTNLDID